MEVISILKQHDINTQQQICPLGRYHRHRDQDTNVSTRGQRSSSHQLLSWLLECFKSFQYEKKKH